MALRSSALILWSAYSAFFAFNSVQGNRGFSCPGWLLNECNEYDPDQCMKNLKNGTDCLKRAPSNARATDILNECKEKICFLLQLEPGLINNGNNDSKPEIPVPCNTIMKAYPHITGPVLDIVGEMFTGKELCLFVDERSCGNYELMHVIESSDYKNHRFAIGPVPEAKLEKCKHQESGAWLDDRIVVVGKFEKTGNFGRAVLVFQPFEADAIGFLVGMFALCIGFVVLIYFRIVIKGKHKNLPFFFVVTGAYTDALEEDARLEQETNVRMEEEGFENKSSNRNSLTSEPSSETIAMKYAIISSLLRFTFYAIIIIFFLFLEAGAVNDLLDRQTTANKRFEREFQNIDKSLYCIQNNTVLSEVLEEKVRDKNVHFVNRTNIKDCFSALRNATDQVKFVVTHKLGADFILSNEGLCDEFTVLELKSNIYDFNSRWIFNSNVDNEYKEMFDRKLVTLRINGTIQKLLNGYAPECATRPRNFRFRTGHTFLIVILFVGIPFAFGVLAFFTCVRPEEPNGQNSA